MATELVPNVLCVPHIMGEGFDVSLLNDQADRVVLSPAASRHWPGQFKKITCEVYAYLHLTGTFTNIPITEGDTHRLRMWTRCEEADILSDVVYGNNRHIKLDCGEEYAEIYIEELRREQRAAFVDQPFDGLFMDNGYRTYAWLTKDPTDDIQWEIFKREVLIRLKRAFSLPIIVNGSASPVAHHMAGRMIEGVPERYGWQETILSVMGEQYASQGSREVILHESEAMWSRKVLTLSLLLGCTYSPRLATGKMHRFIPSGTHRGWEAISDLQIRRTGDQHHYDRLFKEVGTGRRGIATLRFDRKYERVMHARLPWE